MVRNEYNTKINRISIKKNQIYGRAYLSFLGVNTPPVKNEFSWGGWVVEEFIS